MVIPEDINVLICCEESQAESKAFRDKGFNAYSLDIGKPRRGADFSIQIQDDATPYLEGKCDFVTMDGTKHRVAKWHMIISHPPCTYLSKVGAIHLYKEVDSYIRIDDYMIEVNGERWLKMKKAARFFNLCLNAKADFVAVENPIPMHYADLPKPSCFVQPYWYGDAYSKKTLYWLKNLPPLMPDCDMAMYKSFVSCSRGKYRSRTFKGIAKAIAKQWGDFVIDSYNLDLL